MSNLKKEIEPIFNKKYFGFQEGARRLENAMGGIPDQIPVYAQIHEFTMSELDIPATIFYTTPEIITPATLEITERYGVDVGFVDYDVYNIEAEGLGQKVVYFEDHVPDVDRRVPLVTGPDDLGKIKTPDFDSAGRFTSIIEIQTIYTNLTGLAPSLQFCAPFSLAANLRGIQNLIMDILTNPEFARGLFDAIVEEVLAPWILYQRKIFPDVSNIAGADAMASLPIVNLKMLDEWVVPYILKLREICGPQVYVPNWVGERYLEDPQKMLARKILVCPDFLEGQDPDVDALGPTFYKEYAKERDISLILGVGAEFLAHATVDEISERVSEYVRVGGEDGRFALYLCNLGATTPPENLRAAVEAAHSVTPKKVS